MSSEYEVYRTTTLGLALQETLDDLLQQNQIKKDTASKVFREYDKAITKALNRLKNKVEFKSKLHTYRLCDNVWTLVFNGIDITNKDQTQGLGDIKIENEKVKIVACDAKASEKKQLKGHQLFDDQ